MDAYTHAGWAVVIGGVFFHSDQRVRLDGVRRAVCEGDARVAVGAGAHQVAFVQRNTQRSVHPLHGADFLHLNVTVKIYESRALLVRADGIDFGIAHALVNFTDYDVIEVRLRNVDSAENNSQSEQHA